MRYPQRGRVPRIHHYESSQLRVPHRDMWFCNGFKSDVVGAPVTIWSSTQPYIPQINAQKLSIVSSSASDTSAGTHARVIEIQGIGGGGDFIVEARSMFGTTPVATAQDFLYVQSMRVVSTGGTGTTAGNAGTITATYQSTGNIAAVMPVGKCIEQHSHFRVPPGYTAILRQVHVSSWLTGSLFPLREYSIVHLTNPAITGNFAARTVCTEYLQSQMGVLEPSIFIDELESVVIIAAANSGTATGVYTRMGFLLSKKGAV